MELEGDGQRRLKPALAIAAPSQEGIGKDAAVLVDDAVEFRARQCRSADYHGFVVQDILTGLADGIRQMYVIGIKLFQIIADGNVAEAESPLYVIRYHVDGHAVVSV